MIWILAILLLVIVAAGIGAICYKRYKPSKEQYDIQEYFALLTQKQAAVIVDGTVCDEKGLVEDGTFYLPYNVVIGAVNQRFYWDPNEQLLLYTMPDGVRQWTPGGGVLIQDNTVYISSKLIQQYTTMEYSEYTEPNRAVLQVNTQHAVGGMVKKDTQVRYRGGVKSPILEQVTTGQQVRVLEEGNKWDKVCTANGLVGYIRNNCLKKGEYEAHLTQGEPQEYLSMNKNTPIRMAWHQTTNETSNETFSDVISRTKGVNVVSPTWFYLTDEDGTVANLCSSDYVSLAHSQGIEVWALVDNFTREVSTYEVLSYTSKRTYLIDQLIETAVEYDLDGINIDFEELSSQTGTCFVQFIRELSLRCHQNGLILSVDNHIPYDYNAYYGRQEQAVFADYVILMNYDEHPNEKEGMGSVASLSFVESSLTRMLQEIPAEKLINGIPFYTRIWKNGTGADGSASLEWESVGMGKAAQTVAEHGAVTSWDDETQQNYASYTDEQGRNCQIWLEDAGSLRRTLEVCQKNRIAGVAAWKLGLETPDIWDLILEFYPEN